MLRKEYYVIQNKEGKFFKMDNASGGYPYFTEDFEYCEKYTSKDLMEQFLNTSHYTTRMFKKEFEGCTVKTLVMTVE